MKTKKILIFGFIALLVSSCVNYLEPYPQGNYDSDQLWEYQELVQGLIGYCYDQVNSNNRNYVDNEGLYLDGATDDAVLTSSTHAMSRYTQNALTTSQDPFATYWDRNYRAIRNCNLFLKDRRGYNTKYVTTPKWNNMVKNRLQGEAFALRAYFQWDLLQKFGGRGTNGEMLGFPIITEVYQPTDEINLSRNTYDECVKQILDDCDSAYKYLPIAHRDFLLKDDLGKNWPIIGPTVDDDKVYGGGKYWGRFDGISTKAIKAMVYLTWASPRFNPNNDIARWDSAAVNARKVINFKITVDNVSSGFKPADRVVWTNPNSPEIIIATRYNDKNDGIERALYPGGFQGDGVIGPTQELVDAFPMANGKPITDPTSGYNPQDPYTGRDPRFASIIMHNTKKIYKNNTTNAADYYYTFETWDDGPTGPGKDAAGTIMSNSRTNYYVKKYIFAGLNWADGTKVNKQPHSKFLIRWSHMLLTFAEAANNVVGPLDVARYGMSARTAIQYLRARKTYDNANGISPAVPGAPDAYLTSVAAAGKDAFDALVKNERRIETCFEGIRFYDLRRWTTDANWESVINTTVHGAGIIQNANLSFTYNLNKEVASRNFPSPYNPIPFNEMLRMSNLIQNEGWSTWN
jgi:starch-binding outer membrane protein, SusD/RagB family